MLFIPFIENAFKHAVNKKTGNAIHIEMTIANDMLIFNCENSYSKVGFNQPSAGGLGNELILKRLLLLYPGRHTLAVTSDGGIYKVKLELYYNGN
jgi:LytS/YehU family sensor histidine kinase